MTEQQPDESAETPTDTTPARSIRLLLVDDEERFRKSLAERLKLRGYEVDDVDDGVKAIRRVRLFRPDVVLLDRKMPKMSGEETLQEIKRVSPEVQVIILTGHASLGSATATGRLEAFAYLEKPCETSELIHTIEAARQEKEHAMARLEIPQVGSRSIRGWLWGTHNSRPGVMILGALLFAAVYLMPAPQGMVRLLSAPKTGELTDLIARQANYHKMETGETIADD